MGFGLTIADKTAFQHIIHMHTAPSTQQDASNARRCDQGKAPAQLHVAMMQGVAAVKTDLSKPFVALWKKLSS